MGGPPRFGGRGGERDRPYPGGPPPGEPYVDYRGAYAHPPLCNITNQYHFQWIGHLAGMIDPSDPKKIQTAGVIQEGHPPHQGYYQPINIFYDK